MQFMQQPPQQQQQVNLVSNMANLNLNQQPSFPTAPPLQNTFPTTLSQPLVQPQQPITPPVPIINQGN